MFKNQDKMLISYMHEYIMLYIYLHRMYECIMCISDSFYSSDSKTMNRAYRN